jgi:putative transposase
VPDVAVFDHEFEYDFSVQLRYNYRLDPWPRHRAAFGKAFGCARVVFNDALHAREAARKAGELYVTDSELSARLTVVKGTPGRAWLAKVGDVPVRWSRPLPSEPSSVTVIKDSAGRYFASFVVEAGPSTLPAADGLAATACRAQVRPEPVPAQRGEAGTHPKSRQEVA